MNSMQQNVSVIQTVIINKDIGTVFGYFSDYRNDRFWRKEVNSTKLNREPLGKGTIIVQDSFLSGKIPNYITTFVCTEFVPGSSIACETVAGDSFWSKMNRRVETAPGNKTKITYEIAFDIEIVKFGLGFRLPQFIVNSYTKRTMSKYLSVLKGILEQK